MSVLLLTMNFIMHVTLSKGQSSCGCQTVRSHSLRGHHINYKFMCLSKTRQWKLANECTRISAVLVKKKNYTSFSCICPIIDNEFHHTIEKIVCRLSPIHSYFDSASRRMKNWFDCLSSIYLPVDLEAYCHYNSSILFVLNEASIYTKSHARCNRTFL